ncbi:hypothetical protein K2P47_05100 [Patescibacteria group bacterium]|nr:hypothetical protein [Patescibacteria group bacterium]
MLYPSIKKISQTILTLLLLITVFAVSIPTHQAEAGGAGGQATEATQLRNLAQTSISAIADAATALGINSLVIKENILDGIGWAIAKQMVSSMTRSLINWINSGFEGSPAFITDLNAFLLDALDTAAGEYIRSLGGIGEFICSPFRLDIQSALSISYAQARSGMPSGPTAPACRLTDIANNIEGFFAGVTDGGWQDWLSVTSDPQNTPYGSYLEAQYRLKIKLVNEAGQEMEVASWGEGFLSKKICEAIEGPGGGEQCTISTPGQVISEALTFQLSTGPRTLIEADEINELIGALLNQLVLAAMEGINGLLGLSEGTGYTDYSLNGSSTRAYLDDMVDENLINTTQIRSQMGTSLTTERSYLTLASSTLGEANQRLTSVQNAQNAINILFSGTNTGAALANLTRSDTIQTANAKISDELGNRPSDQERTALLAARASIATIEQSLSVIASMGAAGRTATQLSALSFTALQSEGAAIVTELTGLVNEVNPIAQRTTSNVNQLTDMIARYDNATTTRVTTGTGTSTTRSAAAVQNDIAMEYASLVSGNSLVTQLTIDQNRTRWRSILDSE